MSSSSEELIPSSGVETAGITTGPGDMDVVMGEDEVDMAEGGTVMARDVVEDESV